LADGWVIFLKFCQLKYNFEISKKNIKKRSRVVYVHPHREASNLNLGATVPRRLVKFFFLVPFNKNKTVHNYLLKKTTSTYNKLGVILRKQKYKS
jgi:hypothetical protein